MFTCATAPRRRSGPCWSSSTAAGFAVAEAFRGRGYAYEAAAAVLAAPATRPDRYTILEHLALDEGQVRERVAVFVSRLGLPAEPTPAP